VQRYACLPRMENCGRRHPERAMSALEELRSSIPPPENALVGQLDAARQIVEQWLQYPETYWAILESYGAGFFHGEFDGIGLLHPCQPDFCLRLAIASSRIEQPDSTTESDWVPVGWLEEWVLFVKGDGSAAAFGCFGASEPAYVFDLTLPEAILRFADATFRQHLFRDDELSALDATFEKPRFEMAMNFEMLQETVDESCAYLLELARQLSEVAGLDLPQRDWLA